MRWGLHLFIYIYIYIYLYILEIYINYNSFRQLWLISMSGMCQAAQTSKRSRVELLNDESHNGI